MIPINIDSLYSQIFHNAVVAIGVTDPQGTYITVNPTWCELLGYSAEEAIKLNINDVTPEEDRSNSITSFEYLTSKKGNSIRKQRRYQRKDGSIFWADLHASPLYDKDDNVIGLLGVFVNIDKQLHAEQVQKELMNNMEEVNRKLNLANEDLKKLSRHDALTGLYNRRVLEDILEKESNRSQRTKRGFGIAIADIDNFKHVNDTYGHDCGDMVLKELAKVFLKGIRSTDAMGRWGGEEFLFIFPETTCQGAMIVIERIRKKVESLTLEYNGLPIKVSTTIGLSYHHGDTESAVMITEADTALYRGKRSGKNQVICYQDSCTDSE